MGGTTKDEWTTRMDWKHEDWWEERRRGRKEVGCGETKHLGKHRLNHEDSGHGTAIGHPRFDDTGLDAAAGPYELPLLHDLQQQSLDEYDLQNHSPPASDDAPRPV